MRSLGWCLLPLAAIGVSAPVRASSLSSMPAVTFSAAGSHTQSGNPFRRSSNGWQFVASRSITLTHLGLWDDGGNGFTDEHPIGLFRRDDEALLVSGTIPSQNGAQLIEGFRYIDVADVALLPNVSYVIAFYSPQYFPHDSQTSADRVIIQTEKEVFHPFITFDSPYSASGDGELTIPRNRPTVFSPYRDNFGPNFLFVVPEPQSIALATLAALLFRRLRLAPSTSHHLSALANDRLCAL
jgi:hypothetical protein